MYISRQLALRRRTLTIRKTKLFFFIFDWVKPTILCGEADRRRTASEPNGSYVYRIYTS